MGFFDFLRQQPQPAPAKYDQAVIIAGEFESGDEFGTPDERKRLEQLEDEITAVLQPDGGEMDGHDVGEATFTVYVYARDADVLFRTIEPILRRSEFKHLQITKQYGPPQGPNTIDKQFSL